MSDETEKAAGCLGCMVLMFLVGFSVLCTLALGAWFVAHLQFVG